MIPRIPIGSLTPEEFRERFMAPNLPVMLTGAADSWRATAEWVAAAGQPAVSTLAALFPDSEVSVVDGKGKRREMSISEYAAWWERRVEGEPPLYLKDWHLPHLHAEYGAYALPPHVADDWLNEHWSATSGGDGGDSGGSSFLDRVVGRPDASRVRGAQKMTDQISSGRGWLDALRDGSHEMQKAKRDQQVEEQLTKLSECESFTFEYYESELSKALDELENGMTRAQRVQLFADRMQGGNVSKNLDEQKEEVQRTLRIVGEFNAHERKIPKLLDRKARAAIAEKLNVDVSHVENVIFQFQVQHAQWTFLRRERLRGRPIPNNNDEVEWRWKLKPTREFVELMNTFQRRKMELEEARPGYKKPPSDLHINSQQVPLKIRPYLSSSRREVERRKAPPKKDPRHRGPYLLGTRPGKRGTTLQTKIEHDWKQRMNLEPGRGSVYGGE